MNECVHNELQDSAPSANQELETAVTAQELDSVIVIQRSIVSFPTSVKPEFASFLQIRRKSVFGDRFDFSEKQFWVSTFSDVNL